MKCEENDVAINHTIIDRTSNASGHCGIVQMTSNQIDIEMNPKKPTRKKTMKSSQFNCQFCELKYTSKKRLENHMECHGACTQIDLNCLANCHCELI